MNDLPTAIKRRDAARTALAHATASRERGEQMLASAEKDLAKLESVDNAALDRHAARVASWVRDGHAGAPPVLVTDDAHEQALRTAAHSATAARKALATLLADEADAARTLAKAQLILQAITRDQARAEVRAAFEELARLNAQRNALRERLLGAYLADADALTPAEWHRVDHDGHHSAQALHVGLPLLGHRPGDPEFLGGDPRPSRARIDAATHEYHERLARLGESSAPADKAAA